MCAQPGTLLPSSVTHYTSECCRMIISLTPLSDINPAYLMRQHQTPIYNQWNTNTIDNRICTESEAAGTTRSSAMNDLPRSVGDVRWKHVLLPESRRRIGQAQEVCQKKGGFYCGGYKASCYSLCSFLIISPSSHLFSVRLVLYFLSKSFVTAYDLIILSCLSDKFSQSKLFVQIQVPHC